MMRRACFSALTAVLLTACSPSPAPPAATPPASASVSGPMAAATAAAPTAAGPLQMARYDGYGDMRFGMDEAAFRQAWAGELEGQSGQTCFYLWPKWVQVPADFAFMFEHGHFVRYDVGTAKQAAPGGGKVGMDLPRLRQLYSDAKEQPHKYVAGGKYLRAQNPHGDGVLVFEVGADGKVTSWRAGVPPQVDYVEGCS